MSRDSQDKVTESGDVAFTTLPLFQLHSDASEVSGLTNGSIVTAAAPPGISGTVVVNPGGSVNFAPAQSGNGVYFLQCCGNTGQCILQIHRLYGRVDFQREPGADFVLSEVPPELCPACRQRDVIPAGARCPRRHSTHLFGFITQASSGGLIFRFLVGANSANNPATYYFVPAGTEEALFGNGVTLKVTLTWNAKCRHDLPE